MGDQIFTESDLLFTFNEDWVVQKYDDHAYFKTLAGYGLKGVDFVGIYKRSHLYLIEVKNYRQRDYSPVSPDWSDLEGVPIPLLHIFLEKIEDSLKLIRVVYRYLERKWWFNILRKLHNLVGNERLDKDWKFWDKVYKLSCIQESLNYILFIELDSKFLEEKKTNEANFKKQLDSALEKEVDNSEESLFVISKATNLNPLPGLKVEFSKKNRY